jgi:hypothetical protein
LNGLRGGARIPHGHYPSSPDGAPASAANADVTASSASSATNERQYRIVQTEAKKFEQAIAAARSSKPGKGVHPRVRISR